MRSILSRGAACAALFFALALPPVQAQETEADRLPLNLRARGGAVTTTPGIPVPLEGPLDPRTYRIGPGDVFSVSVGGAAAAQLLVPVSADGFVVLPTVGAVPVAGLSLDAARDRIVNALRPYFRSGVDAALATPRSFYVHVSGAVAAPGRLPMGPVSRLEDALVAALVPASAVDTLRGPRPGTAPALRSVRVEHPDGSGETYDLLRYRRLGDLAQNPYLRDGDRVVVAAFDSLVSGIRVSGAVTFPGIYEGRPGDTVLGLLEIADGPLRPGDPRTVRVDGEAPVRVADLLAAPASAPGVPSGATLYVEGDRERGTVRVEGAVAMPGAQTIRQGRTSVREAIQAAGGLRPDALARGAYLVRPTGPRIPRASDLAMRALQGAGDLSFVQRAALADSAGLTLVSIPGDALTGGLDLPVFDGDRIVIPRDEQTVLVTGAVARPGFVPVRAGTRAGAYLEAAGGLRREAREVFLVSAGTQQMTPAEGSTPQSGDVLVVTAESPATGVGLYTLSLQERQIAFQDRQFALQERQFVFQQQQERRNRRFQVISTALATLSTVAGFVTTYLILREQKNDQTTAGN